MTRQDGRIPKHFAPEGKVLCVVGRRAGVELQSTPDAREVTCGQCERLPEWKTAWKNAARVARASMPNRKV